MPQVYVLEISVVFILGLLFGSFANVCIYRLPQRLSVVFPASHCPTCQTTLRPWQNIPLLSYLCQGGRCTTCYAAIGSRYLLVELGNGLLYLLLYHYYQFTLYGLVLALLTTTLLVVSCIDLVHTIIPDTITLPGIVVGLCASSWLTPVGWQNALVGMLLGGGLFVLIAVLSVVILHREGMGGGDMKLIAMLGAFLGWQAVLVTIFVGAMCGAVIGLSLMWWHRKQRYAAIPFGPFLAFGALCAMLWGERLLTWYTTQAWE